MHGPNDLAKPSEFGIGSKTNNDSKIASAGASSDIPFPLLLSMCVYISRSLASDHVKTWVGMIRSEMQY